MLRDYLNLLVKFHEEDPDGNGVAGDTYGVVAAGFLGNEAPYINYLPEFWQDAYPAILQGEDTGRPNLLRAIYEVMEESAERDITKGIDTI